MTAPAVNIPLLRKVVEWAEAEAKLGDDGHWNQYFVASERACGTTYCIAGYVVALQTGYADPYAAPETANADVVGFAHEQLGIPGDGDNWSPLFMGSNTIEDIRRIAEDLAGERL